MHMCHDTGLSRTKGGGAEPKRRFIKAVHLPNEGCITPFLCA